MRIALVSTGLGRVLRGFESFTESLFHALRLYAPHIDVTLFQGGGQRGERRIVIPNLHRFDAPARWFGYEKGNQLEKRSFALALYPLLRSGGYDIVHYNELVMGSALFHLRRWLGGKFKLLYCNGAPSPPVHYHHRCDFAQMLHGPMYDEAIAYGLPESRLFLLSYGVDTEHFSTNTHSFRLATRRELGIPADALVVMTAAALNCWHKRVDYIIREVAALDVPVWFIGAGERTDETPHLEKKAERLLPNRYRFLSWPHNKVNLLYGAADAFVLASLSEGFGMVIIEALASGVPVIVHNGPQFRWITDQTDSKCIDMAQPGTLTATLNQILFSNPVSNGRAVAVERFSWDSLIPEYLRMYEIIGNP